MFSDCLIAENFSMSKTKRSYLININYRLAVHFKEKLVKTIKDSPFLLHLVMKV